MYGRNAENPDAIATIEQPLALIADGDDAFLVTAKQELELWTVDDLQKKLDSALNSLVVSDLPEEYKMLAVLSEPVAGNKLPDSLKNTIKTEFGAKLESLVENNKAQLQQAVVDALEGLPNAPAKRTTKHAAKRSKSRRQCCRCRSRNTAAQASARRLANLGVDYNWHCCIVYYHCHYLCDCTCIVVANNDSSIVSTIT